MNHSNRVLEWRKIKFDKGTAYWRYKRIFDNVKGRTILDVGTGNGYITYELSKDHEVTTIDISRKAVSSLRENLRSLGLKANFVTDDFLKHDFKQRFDTVILAEFIEHFNESDAKRIIKKAYKLADKTIIISTPNRDLVVQVEPTHVNEYNFDEFKELLADYHPVIYGTILADMSGKEGFELAKEDPSKSRTLVALINKIIK